jgi:hypothetical protein
MAVVCDRSRIVRGTVLFFQVRIGQDTSLNK